MGTTSAAAADNFNDFTKLKYNDYSFLINNYRGTLAKAIRENCYYIESLVQEVGIPLSAVEPSWFLSSAREIGSFILDRNEVNKIFFTKAKEIMAKASEIKPVDISKSILKQIETARKAAIDQEIKQANHDFKLCVDEAYNCAKRESDYIRSAHNYWIKAQSLSEGKIPDMKKEIAKITKAGFWAFDGFYNDRIIRFSTKNNVVLEHKNEKANTHFRVDLGSYFAEYDFKTPIIKIICRKDNVFSGSHWHPHINTNGKVCWGNAEQTAVKACATFEIAKLLSIIQIILTTYNQHSPYASIEGFQSASGQPMPGKGELNKSELIEAEAARTSAMPENYVDCQHCGRAVDNEHLICRRCDACADACRCESGPVIGRADTTVAVPDSSGITVQMMHEAVQRMRVRNDDMPVRVEDQSYRLRYSPVDQTSGVMNVQVVHEIGEEEESAPPANSRDEESLEF